MQVAQDLDQILQRPPEAIDRPGSDHIELPPRHALEQRIQARPVLATLGARYAIVGEDLHQLPAMPFGDRLKFAPLVRRVLSGGRHPQIERDPLCGCRAAFRFAMTPPPIDC